jgi:hypothetical protein
MIDLFMISRIELLYTCVTILSLMFSYQLLLLYLSKIEVVLLKFSLKPVLFWLY